MLWGIFSTSLTLLSTCNCSPCSYLFFSKASSFYFFLKAFASSISAKIVSLFLLFSSSSILFLSSSSFNSFSLSYLAISLVLAISSRASLFILAIESSHSSSPFYHCLATFSLFSFSNFSFSKAAALSAFFFSILSAASLADLANLSASVSVKP